MRRRVVIVEKPEPRKRRSAPRGRACPGVQPLRATLGERVIAKQLERSCSRA